MATTPTRAYKINFTAAGGDEKIYENPSDRKGVINMISLTNTSAGAVVVDVKIDIGGAGTTEVYILSQRSLAADETYTFDGVLTLDEDDDLVLDTDTNNQPHAYVSIVQVT